MIVVSVIGIILAFAVLIFAAYKKISMFLAAVLAAAIVALFLSIPYWKNSIHVNKEKGGARNA